MATTTLEARLASLEAMFSSESSTGFCAVLEKKIQTVINQHLSELECRTIALTDSKIDTADCYLKLKSKVERNDFEKMLNQILTMKNEFRELRESNECLKKSTEDRETALAGEIRKLQGSITDTQQEVQERYQQLSTQVLTRGPLAKEPAKSGPTSEELGQTLDHIAKLEASISGLCPRIDSVEKSQLASISNINEARTMISQTKSEIVQQAAKAAENADKIVAVKSQVTAQSKTADEQHANILKEVRRISEKVEEKMVDLEGALDQVRRKYSALESKQATLTSEFSSQFVIGKGADRADDRKCAELADEMKERTAAVMKEYGIIRKEFDDVRAALEGELMRLRSENELILKEYDRIYEQNRDMEMQLSKLVQHAGSVPKRRTFYGQTKGLLNESINTGEGNQQTEKVTPATSKEITSYFPRKPDESARKSRSINIRTKRYREASSISDYQTTNNNKSVAERLSEATARDPPKSALCNRSLTSQGRPGGEKIFLNRFKMLIE